MTTKGDPLDGLQTTHPRVLAHEDDFTRIRQLVLEDERASHWHAQLEARAERMLDEPVVRHHLRDGNRLLYETRELIARVLTLGLLHRLEPNPRYVQRIWADVGAAASFPDWNPVHAIEVGEMAFGFAIAYDWLYDDWTPEQRRVIREAIVKHAMAFGVAEHRDGAWWTKIAHNFNQVGHGGLIAAALAVADEEPTLAAEIIERSVGSLPIAMSVYAPDGGYQEGLTYWDYGTGYNVIAIASLESALGHDFGLGDIPGFNATGLFPIQMTGPTGVCFNFGDARESSLRFSALSYLATRYNLPACARFAVKHHTGETLDLLWYEPQLIARSSAAMPLEALYENADVAVMRSAWDDPDALFVAVKGGRVHGSHAQLDFGSFVLEADGVRWIVDLGLDDYNLPGYFDLKNDRWTYYRNRAEGHNTILINPSAGPDQGVEAQAPVSLSESTATIDLSQAYPAHVVRQVMLDRERKLVEVHDEVDATEEMSGWWFAHTRAHVTLSSTGRSAIMEQAGQTMNVELIEPATGSFVVMDAQPLPQSPNPPGQNPNNGAELKNLAAGANFVQTGELPAYGEPNPDQAIRKLAIHFNGVKRAIIRVRFAPEAH